MIFNFDDATFISLGGQFTASMLALFAVVTGNSSIDGTIIAAQVADNGEVHNAEFTGGLRGVLTAVTPEPVGVLLMGSGMICVAGRMMWKRRIGPVTRINA
jgi:hypothetical protein